MHVWNINAYYFPRSIALSIYGYLLIYNSIIYVYIVIEYTKCSWCSPFFFPFMAALFEKFSHVTCLFLIKVLSNNREVRTATVKTALENP